MGLNATDARIVASLEGGLPLVAEPYRELAKDLGLSEAEFRRRIGELVDNGTFGRFGVIVRHRELGYKVAAMVVWDIPDEEVSEAGRQLADQGAVNLCYRRPRMLPDWPYNVFTMLHGRSRADIDRQLDAVAAATELADLPRAVLYTRRRFKQRGPRYFLGNEKVARA